MRQGVKPKGVVYNSISRSAKDRNERVKLTFFFSLSFSFVNFVGPCQACVPKTNDGQ